MEPLEEFEMQKSTLWSNLTWSPTSLLKAHTAEHRLLARMPFFKSHIVLQNKMPYKNDTSRTKSTHKLVEGKLVVSLPDVPVEKIETVELPVNSTARIGLVSIGLGRRINTLVIDTDVDSTNNTGKDTNLDSISIIIGIVFNN